MSRVVQLREARSDQADRISASITEFLAAHSVLQKSGRLLREHLTLVDELIESLPDGIEKETLRLQSESGRAALFKSFEQLSNYVRSFPACPTQLRS